MKSNWKTKFFTGAVLFSQFISPVSVIAISNHPEYGGTVNSSMSPENTVEDENIKGNSTIAPVVVGYEDSTDIKISEKQFSLKIVGELLDNEYEYVLPDELNVDSIEGDVKYNKKNHSLVFPKNISFSSDIRFSSTATDEKKYTFDFSFNNSVSTVILNVTIASSLNSTLESSSAPNNIKNENSSDKQHSDSETTSSSSAVDESQTVVDNQEGYAATDAIKPSVIGNLKTAPNSINQDTMGELPKKFNFSPKIYKGITKVGYNTKNANQDISATYLTDNDMKMIQSTGGYYVYYKRAGIYQGRYIDIKWTFNKSPYIYTGLGSKFRLHTALNSSYIDDIMMSITNVSYNSQINTELTFYDSETLKSTEVSGFTTYGNVDNSEYYLFDDSKISNYIYSFSKTNLNYVKDDKNPPKSTKFGVQGQTAGVNVIDETNTFTILYEDQHSFPITYGQVAGHAGKDVWLGAVDLNLLRIGYDAPFLYGDEANSNLEDNVLEYRAIQQNPSRGGGQTQIVLPNEYKINMDIENYELLNPIKSSDIVIKNLNNGKDITSSFDITITSKGSITLNLKNVSNASIQKDNFPSTFEIKFKATPKNGVDLYETYKVIDGQGYYVFPISGNLTYKQPAVPNSIVLEANKAEAKIKTNEPPIPTPVKTFKNITEDDGLVRNNGEVYIGDILEYEINIKNIFDELKEITIVDELPEKKLYRKIGSYRLTVNGENIILPEDFYNQEKNELKTILENIPANSNISLKYQLQVTGIAQQSQLVNKVKVILDDGLFKQSDAKTSIVSKVPILNPEKPTEIIEPERGSVGNQLGNLNLVYVPSFYFGEQEITNKNSEYSAELLKTKDGEGVPNFVQIHDTNQDDFGWKLSMNLSEFYDSDKDNSLDGAQLVLKNSQLNTFKGLDSEFEGNLPQDVELVAGGDSNIIAESASLEDTQNTIIAFGSTEKNTAKDSVILRVPGSVKKIDDTYSANLDWQLQNVPD